MRRENAVQILRDDHKRVRGLFRQFEAADMRAHEMESGVASQIFMELEIHFHVEQEVFYPAYRDVADVDGKLWTDQAWDEHQSMQAMIDELRKLDVDNESYRAKFRRLIDAAELHMGEEEDRIFPTAEVLLEKYLMGLGDKITALRNEYLNFPQYRSAHPEFVQDPHGGEQKRKHAA